MVDSSVLFKGMAGRSCAPTTRMGASKDAKQLLVFDLQGCGQIIRAGSSVTNTAVVCVQNGFFGHDHASVMGANCPENGFLIQWLKAAQIDDLDGLFQLALFSFQAPANNAAVRPFHR